MSGTPWSAGRLAAGGGPARVLFGRMYEDSEIEREAFRGKWRVFAIASAGCTAKALAGEHDVVACDINPAQLAYARRRLSGGAREEGEAERAMRFARALAPLAGWNRGRLEEFLAMEDVGKQPLFWREHLDTAMFRFGFGAMLSRGGLSLVYSREYLECLPRGFGAVLRRRMAAGFGRHPNAGNPFARALLLGDPEADAGGSLGGQVEWVLNDAASYLEGCAAGSFHGFALSNILDGAPESYRRRLMGAVRRASAEDGVVVRRSFSEPPAGLRENAAVRDRSLLWGVLEVREAKGWGEAVR